MAENIRDETSLSRSTTNVSTEIVIVLEYRIPEMPGEESTPWYRRMFKRRTQLEESQSSDSLSESSNEDNLESTVLEVKNVHKTYLLGLEGVPAIRGVNLTVLRGEFVIIVGKSGSGKSSLLNILGTVDNPTRGELEISGILFNSKVRDRTISQIRLRAIGFIFQTFNLIPGMTAAQNVELPLILKGELTRAQRRQAVSELLQRVGMSDRGDHYPSQLSGGEQQRVSIARGLANTPDMLLLDEPTGDLDTLNTIRIINLLVGLNNMGTTLVMVTHDMMLPNIATRVVVMSDGKVNETIENNDNLRYTALQKLNEGIEDLTLFESGDPSTDSARNCSSTEFRTPANYECTHVLESTEDRFSFQRQYMEQHPMSGQS